MINEENGNSIELEDGLLTETGSKLETTKLPEVSPEDTNSSAPIATEKSEVVEAIEQSVEAEESRSSSAEPASLTDEEVPSRAAEPVFVQKPQSFFAEQPSPVIVMAPRVLRYRTRREVLGFGIGAVATAAGAGLLLPQATLDR